jgi:hypothetical protein
MPTGLSPIALATLARYARYARYAAAGAAAVQLLLSWAGIADATHQVCAPPPPIGGDVGSVDCGCDCVGGGGGGGGGK